MPLANIKVIEGIFTDSEKRQMIAKVTDALDVVHKVTAAKVDVHDRPIRVATIQQQ